MVLLLGDAMTKTMMVLVAVMLQAAPALARDMLDEKTHEYTPYGVAIALIAAAQINEMSCHKEGQMALALAKVNRMGMEIDLNTKEDYSAVLFQAQRIMEKAKKEGEAKWCAARSDQMDQFLRKP